MLAIQNLAISKMLKRIHLIFLFSAILLIPSVFASVRINEIIYTPTSELGGSTNEWIEIYNPEDVSVELNNWTFSEMTSTGDIKLHTINNGTILANGYLILARNDTKFNNYFDVDCSVIKVSFGYGLNNEGDNISLINSNGEVVDSVSYTDSIINKSNSLQLLNGWCEGVSTPGKENVCIHSEIEENITENTANTSENTESPLVNDSPSEPEQEDIIINVQNESSISQNQNILKEGNASKTDKTGAAEQNNDATAGITGNVIYESKNEKLKTISMEILALLLIALIIFNIIKKR